MDFEELINRMILGQEMFYKKHSCLSDLIAIHPRYKAIIDHYNRRFEDQTFYYGYNNVSIPKEPRVILMGMSVIYSFYLEKDNFLFLVEDDFKIKIDTIQIYWITEENKITGKSVSPCSQSRMLVVDFSKNEPE